MPGFLQRPAWMRPCRGCPMMEGMTLPPTEGGLDAFLNPETDYPANHFALQYVLNALADRPQPTLVEVGTGHATALEPLIRAGIEVSGFDIDPSVVPVARETMAALGRDPESVTVGDIEDPVSYATVLRDGPYDALLALGVLPNVANESRALRNMQALVRPGGEVFVEFRNVLFSLFTSNRHTRNFIVDELLADVSDDLRAAVSDVLESRVDMDRPPLPRAGASAWRFHNPFEVAERFASLGFVDVRPHFFHYHPAMPFLASEHPVSFRRESLRLENEASGWRGMFLCSAFLIHARRPLIAVGEASSSIPHGV